ncbi:hypothetical protein SAMN03159316_4007 [Pseudomonas sp. NFR02]|uniref:hypothetical protein n=1 Tax=Pseudomonas sp. NFR02 TaxID=1566229 RepID=UPI00091A119D|nr:hypothetical protein [Pseudomonas sp. NFR02]SFY17434.1 hypothetical protein SAMN03159316_4007 [Pseudomonas sp. NFR02]
MEPVSMIAVGAAASVALPIAGKAAEMGMDLPKDVMDRVTDVMNRVTDGAQGGQLGADPQSSAPPPINF